MGYPRVITSEYPCHKIMTDWLILFAFSHVKHIEFVSLSGAIKTATMKKWTIILRPEFCERNLEGRIHGFDFDEESETVMRC
jgi:hypothetical protein